MKKILTHLTGIVILIAILVEGSCNKSTEEYSRHMEEISDATETRAPKEVRVHFKVKKRDGEKHLKMYNYYKPDFKAIDTLITFVLPGDTVVWEPATFLSRIKKIDSIGTDTQGEIFGGYAEKIPGTMNFRYIVPENIPKGTKEKYDIIFIDRLKREWKIDPYLKIP